MTKTIASLLLRAAMLALPLGFTACSSLGVVAPNAPAVLPSSTAAPATPYLPDQDAVNEPRVNPDDDLALGKRHYAEGSYGLAEQHFRRAVEKSSGPRSRDAEAWMGLAASYDRLRRFDLADRAYKQAIRAIGSTPEILNNQGFSFMLRRDFKRARVALTLAQQKDPENVYIRNNLALLNENAGAPLR